jgi:DNA polymerase
MPDRLHNDFETRSNLNLKKVQLSRYARDRSTKVLMCSYAFNDGPVKQWVPAEGERMPAELREAYTDREVVKIAWNAPFEMAVCRHVLGLSIDPFEWRCAMVMAMSLALPASLEKCGEVIGLSPDMAKVSRSKHLIRLFTQPRTPTKTKPWAWANQATDPEKWEEFKDYNRQDTVSERAVHKRIRRWDLPDHEWDLWVLDQQINEAGFPVNMRCVKNALKLIDDLIYKRIAEMKDITSLENPNSNEQLLGWLGKNGYPFYDLKKGHVTRALEEADKKSGPMPLDQYTELQSYKRVLKLRQEVSKTSTKKYNALNVITDDDNLYRYGHQFCGAGRTWRWSGRGYQHQNLLRPIDYLIPYQADCVRDLQYLDATMFEAFWDKPFDVLATCVRPVVQAPEGYVFIDADLNAIENRVLGWMAMDRKILRVFELKRDPYIDFATYMYGQDYDTLYAEYKAGNKQKRQIAKPPVLAAGYGLGPGEEKENSDTGEIEATGLLGYAWNMGVKMVLKESAYAVKVWRETYSDVLELWKGLDKAARKCIRTGDRTTCEVFEFNINGPFMRMRLPSGRHLHYCRPKIEPRKTPWGEVRPTITYEQLNDKNQWVRVSTHPGKITENGDQAIARDLLAHGMMLAHRRGIDIRIHVHDQIVGLSKEDKAERELEILLDSMKTVPRWARGLPIDAAGSVSKLFVKD